MIMVRWFLMPGLLLLLGNCSYQLPDEIRAAYGNLPDQIDFNFHVKPILSDKCFACHGPDHESLQAGLRLDLRENALNRKESGETPIMPGNSGRSHLVERILSDNPEMVMPPPDSHLQLNDTEIATIIKWIDQGAMYKPHWSFIKPEKAALPSVNEQDWPRNPVDNFVLRQMEVNGFQPSPPAEKSTIARRLYFNLTGLPPTLEDLNALVQDQSPEAYEKLIDQLLASPAYGERMAMEWMDASRYADSDGYLDDKHRDFSPWRDWVIEAFNRNMPYDEFVTSQLAGDLIENPTRQSILATAFNRLHRKNSEAGIVFEEYRTEYVADRTNTLGTAFLGLSLECARCHDHKYDPVSQQDYYQLFAFFNSTAELGTAIYGPDQTPGPALLLSGKEQEEILDYLNSGVDQKEEQLKEITSVPGEQYRSWVGQKQEIPVMLGAGKNQGLVAYYDFDQLGSSQDRDTFQNINKAGGKPAVVNEPDIDPGFKGKAVFLNDYTSITLPEKLGWFGRTDPFTISLAVYPDTLYQDAGLFYHCEDFRLGLKGYSLFLDHNHLRFVIAHSWPQNAIQVRSKEPLKIREWTQVTITYDGSSKAGGVSIFLDGQKVPLLVDYDQLYKGIFYQPDIHTYGFSGFTLGIRDKMKTFLHGGIDELKIFRRELTALEALYEFNPETATSLIADLDTEHPLLLEYYHKYFNKQAAEIRHQLHLQRTRLNDTINGIPEIMVMGDLSDSRPTFVLNRGVYDAPGKQVEPGTPEVILAFDQAFPKNRLGLARWLFHQDNPLTARVFVNRIWQMHFGQGIVKTADDFGSQGEIPTHPDLLDWLAVEFIESGWDIKHLHKTIVMSATFQQSSRTSAAQIESDPDNRFLARGPSYRLKAEMIRDNALAVSGLLVKKIGGRSVYPYQPEGLWDEISNKIWRYRYLQEPGEGLYRRSLYTIWKRTSPPPAMLVFDVPDRSVCRVRRAHTSTPLQALVLLNDPQYIEAARALAEMTIKESNGGPPTQLSDVFAMITGRFPDEEEVALLNSFYQQELDRFKAHTGDAQAYLSVGEYQAKYSAEPEEVAALATVISGIMNTSESYTLR